MCFHRNFSQWDYCSLNVVLSLKQGPPQSTIFIIQIHPSKGVQKNKLKERDFTKNRLWLWYQFEENFPNNYSSEWHKTNTFNSCFNGGLYGLNLKMEMVKRFKLVKRFKFYLFSSLYIVIYILRTVSVYRKKKDPGP